MLGQACPANESSSAPLEVQTHQAAVSQDVASRQSTRFLWTALGFAVLALIVVSACTTLPLAAHATVASPSDSQMVAFMETLPALQGVKQRHSISVQGMRTQGPPVASTVLKKAPPAPPPPPSENWGRRGHGGDNNPEYEVDKIEDEEAIAVLDDWIAREKVYKLDVFFCW